MTKYVFAFMIAISITLLSCVRDRIVCTLEVEYCSGILDTVEYRGYIKPRIHTYREALPVIDGKAGWNVGDQTKIINVCKFRVLK